MAINPRELRIGNLLSYHTDEGHILPATIDWQALQWLTEDPKGFNLTHSPIPLTEERIKRKPSSIKEWKGNGADYQPETSKTRQVFYELSDCISLVFQTWSWRKTEDSEWTHDHSILLEFHHEFIHLTKNEFHTLQNLYFGLTGEELDFSNVS